MSKISAHDVRRKDTAKYQSMEFNETSSICSLLLLKSIVKVSHHKTIFSSEYTTHDVSTVLLYWG